MAGLFEKDIRLIMQRKNVLMILMLLSVFLAYTQEGTFIVSYLPAVATIMIIGTMSYDELDKWISVFTDTSCNYKNICNRKIYLLRCRHIYVMDFSSCTVFFYGSSAWK